MTSTAKARACPTPTARQKQVWDKAAPGYDRQIAFFEKIQFAGGREWLGARARGRVLDVAIAAGSSPWSRQPASRSWKPNGSRPGPSSASTPSSPPEPAAPARGPQADPWQDH